MKTISKKIKVLILLAVAFVACAFMAYSFKSPSYASADVSAAQNLIVKSAQVIAQTDQSTGDDEWAIMFKAQIDLDSYNALTNSGSSYAKFGMLIGPKKFADNISDYASAIANEYIAFAHVGTSSASSSGVQTISFGSNTVYSYQAGIVFNEEFLNSHHINLLDAALLELTAIPFYMTSSSVSSAVLILDNQKSCLPRNILVDSYIQEQAQGVNNIPVLAVNKYAGQFVEEQGEFYLCQSTNRLFCAPSENADLVPTKLSLSSSDELFVAGKKQISADSVNLDPETIGQLTVGDTYGVTIYTADNYIINRSAKLATRVITRFFKDDTDSELDDCLVYYNPDVVLDGSAQYVSIFYNPQDGGNKPTVQHDGLFVLANDITPNVKSRAFISGNKYTGGDAVQDKGFTGTFDGRTKMIDFNYGLSKVYAYRGGMFNSMYGATIKNIAFNDILISPISYAFLAAGANYCTFENVYIKIYGVGSDFHDRWNAHLLFSTVNNTTFKNFIVDCDVADYNHYDEVLVAQKNYDNFFYSETLKQIAYVDVGDSDEDGNTTEHLKADLGFGFNTSALMGWDIANNTSGGNTATNFFSIGANPILMKMTSASNPLANYTARVLVSKQLKYKILGSITTNISTKTAYAQSTFDGTEFETYVSHYYEHVKYSIESRWSKGMTKYFEDKGTELKIYFYYVAGFNDISNSKEMREYMLNNPSTMQAFSGESGNGCWHVNNSTGVVKWKSLV